MKFTAAKAKVAAVLNTLAAIQIYLGVVATALGDDEIGFEEITPLVTGAITLGVAVYGVWKTKNEPIQNGTSYRTQV